MKAAPEQQTSDAAYRAVVDEYRALAPRYDTRWARYSELTHQLTAAALPLERTGSVLDVACGTGSMLEQLLRQKPDLHVAGSDISADMLAVAKTRISDDLCQHTDWRNEAAEHLSYADESFDAVICNNALHFFPDPDKAVTEMRRVLRPGGCVVLTDWCKDFWTMRAYDVAARITDSAYQQMFSSRDISVLLSDSGFTTEQVQRCKINWFWGMFTATASKR